MAQHVNQLQGAFAVDDDVAVADEGEVVVANRVGNERSHAL